MTISNFIYLVIVSVLLALGQVLIKLGLNEIAEFKLDFSTSFSYSKLLFTSLYIWLGIISTGISMLIWINILSKVKLSTAYPLISLSYIFGLLGAVFILKESVPFIRWVGVIVIIFGIFLITR